MGERVIDYCAKGPICYCLDEFSKGRGARARVARLHGALVALRPAFEGLAEVFNEHLLSHVISNADARARALEYLESWFNPSSAGYYFPAVPVASIYGEGVIKALELVLASRPGRLASIISWWVPRFPEVNLVSLTDVRDGVTIGSHVTLLILTPPPPAPPEGDRASDTPLPPSLLQGGTRRILGTQNAHWTEHRNGSVRTIDVRTIPLTRE